MPTRKKKFIDKKNSLSFNLVHRSQQDPLVADEKAPQHVLLPVSTKNKKPEEDEKRKEEQRKFGVYFDDDYNYLQHLRDVNKQPVEWVPVEKFHLNENEFPPLSSECKPNEFPPVSSERKAKEEKDLKLPSSVFASEFEEEVGLLNKAAPIRGLQLDLDPDVVAAMDDDFDFDDPDNQLDDDFINAANRTPDESEYSEDDDFGDISSGADNEDDEVGSLNGRLHTFLEEETKSRFTSYSLSSSVIRRNEQLTLLDDRFEKMFEMYDDTEIGALDCEDIEGHIPPDSEQLLQCVEEFKKEQEDNKQNMLTRPTVLRREVGSDSSTEEDMMEMEVKEPEQWDCESILSTYSNLYNHPKLIEEPSKPGIIRISQKTGIPFDVLHRKGLTARDLKQLDASYNSRDICDGTESILSAISTLSVRPKDETPEDRRQRKKALKECRRERRVERKANTLAFKEEKKRQEKMLVNNKMNIQGIKIV